MPSVGIVTDSSTCIPRDFARERGIGVGSVAVTMEGDTYVDGVTLLPEDLYGHIERGAHVVSSAVNLGEFEQAMEELLQSRQSLVGVLLGETLSATRRNFQMAAASFEDRQIASVETGGAAMGLGAIALETARHANAGADFERVQEVARQAVEGHRTYVVTPNLKGLIDIARLSGSPETFDSFKGYLAILKIGEGRIAPVGKAKDDDEAIRDVVEQLAAETAAGRPHVAIIGHARAEKQAAQLLRAAKARMSIDEAHTFLNTATVTAVIGLGSYGIGVAPRID